MEICLERKISERFFSSSRIGRHYLQSQASIEVLRMLEIPEVFHSFSPTDHVELFTAATVRFSMRETKRSMDSDVLYLASKCPCSSSFSPTYFKQSRSMEIISFVSWFYHCCAQR